MSEHETYTFLIEEKLQGTRLDLVLSLLLVEVSRSFIQKLIEGGKVEINRGRETSKKYKVKEGDHLKITLPVEEKTKIEAEKIPLDIVYEDEDVLVVNKPRGMVVHPGAGNDKQTLVNGLLYHLGDNLSDVNGQLRPGIVHRIDKDTSGLLMVAKNNKAHEALAEQLAKHSTTRKYVALVHHGFHQDRGTIDEPIGRDPKNRLRYAVTEINSKKAITHWKVLERLGKYTLIEAVLETGRTHQIRVHMAYIKHPVVGDPVYGPKKLSKKAELFHEGQLLHAKTLGFLHPKTGAYLEFSAELPEDFQEVLRKLREK